MDISKNSGQKTPDGDSPFTGWGTIVGSGLGLAIGLFTRHWAAWTFGVGSIGLCIGAFIDRSRRN